ncbi:unnamed protein product [Dovyalis caffra]|uniref:Uncharacterized protein n=1 Tax=Dovyalis caffra TaxID=77055 RepID=A0AAV1SRH0_9ROSI|nr:unnamed protein product [Dovyalis caffra]
MTGQIRLIGRSHERQKWGLYASKNTIKGQHHKLDMGQIDLGNKNGINCLASSTEMYGNFQQSHPCNLRFPVNSTTA